MMAQALISAGHEVIMACGSYGVGKTGLIGHFRKGKRKGIVDGIQVVEFNIPYSNEHGFFKRSIAFLRYLIKSVLLSMSSRHDLVIATSTPLTAGLIGSIARWITLKPFVFEVRDMWPELPKAMGIIKNPIILKVMSLIEWVSYRSANKIVSLAPGMATSISRKGIPSDKITFIPNGCDMKLFDPDGSLEWRPQGVEYGDFLGVYAGTLGVANGIDSILEVAKVLKGRGRTDIKIVLIGDGKLKSELYSKSKLLGLRNVIFHQPVDKKRLAGLFRSADVGFQLLQNIPAFYYGTSPNKFFDYIAAGLPVITNYPGWVADLILENDAGLVADPGDYVMFANFLEELSQNSESLRIKGVNARQLAIQTFDRVELSERFVKVVEHVHATS